MKEKLSKIDKILDSILDNIDLFEKYLLIEDSKYFETFNEIEKTKKENDDDK